MSIQQEVGRNIVYLRNKRGISQEILAFDAEVSVSYLRTVEHGEANPTLEFISKLATVLMVRPEFLLTPNAAAATHPLPDETDYVPVSTTEYLFVGRALSFLVCEECRNRIELERKRTLDSLPEEIDKGTQLSFIDGIVKAWRNTNDDLPIANRQNHR